MNLKQDDGTKQTHKARRTLNEWDYPNASLEKRMILNELCTKPNLLNTSLTNNKGMTLRKHLVLRRSRKTLIDSRRELRVKVRKQEKYTGPFTRKSHPNWKMMRLIQFNWTMREMSITQNMKIHLPERLFKHRRVHLTLSRSRIRYSSTYSSGSSMLFKRMDR